MERLSQSPTDPNFVQNPYPFYDRARTEGDLFFWEDYGMVCATSVAAVNAAMRDRRLGRAVPPEAAPEIPEHLVPFYAVEAHSMLELEPPRHTRLRGLVMRAFTSRRIAELAPEIEGLCHSLIDRFPDAPFDLLPAYATPVPVIVIARLLGVPESMADQLLDWSNAMVAMYQARRTPEIEARAVAATQEFTAFLRSYIDDRRRQPGDDLITHLIAAEEDGDKLSTDELITTCILLLNAGHEATVHTLGNGVAALCAHGRGGIPDPAWLAPDTISGTVEEILRYDPPLHMFTRWVYEDLELEGYPFKRGDQIACLLGAAGRDPNVWNKPNQFVPTRATTSHAAFGAGLHFCVGAPLARLELQIALQVLFSRRPNLRLSETPRYANLYHFHGLEHLGVQM